jgi:DNA-binding response OmpR family regulator
MSLRALVIDDAPEIAELVEFALRRGGYEVSIAVDGERGIEAAKAQQPDVILLDLTLPGIDGFETCRRLRTFSDACIVILSGAVRDSDREGSIAAGADGHIAKPFSPKDLARQVAELRDARGGRFAAGETTSAG